MAYQIGTTVEGLATLSSLGIPDPDVRESTYEPYADYVQLADMSYRGMGLPRTQWYWSFLRQDQRDALRVYCETPSAVVFIETRTSEDGDSFAVFQAVMTWPKVENRGRPRHNFPRFDFVVKFSGMVEQELA